jgi:GNAT superfamily N-acetyltransferase
MTVEPGTLDDWRRLCGFHYRSHSCAGTRKIYCLRRRGWLVSVIVYAYPPPNCSGRGLVLPRMPIKELNKKLSIISRVVIHPKYRSIGLGAKLIRETLPQVGTPYVEMVAVMAKYNPFAEKAGMRNVITKDPPKEALGMAEVLKDFGFDLQLLSSERYVRSKLEALSVEQVAALRRAFIENDHQRFRKEFAALRHVPYGTSKAYREGIEAADLEKIAKLIRIVGVLLQTKVYLFWSRNAS